MKIGPGGAALREIGQLFEGDSVAGLGEVQLLERFVARRDEPAFAALVARHGPMVLGVCRRLLANPLDVEDAFQATFLVLVRRAGSLRDRDRLAPWLFGVARRVATRARQEAARRQARERPGTDDAAGPSTRTEHHSELGRALVEEIDRLPDSLRLAVVLCCVEGRTYEEAAARLGSTGPAIRGRLSRARERLRGRLTRRGFAPAAGALGAMLPAEMTSAAIPATLLTSTTRLAIGFAGGRAATTGAVPAAVATLAEGVIRTMILTKSKIVAAAVVACGVAASGVGVLGQDPGPSDSARLGGVEQKLDRLIKILEVGNRPTPGEAMFKSVIRPTPGGIPGPAASVVTVPPPGEPVMIPGPAMGMMPGPGMPKMIGGMMGGAGLTNTSARLQAVEQRLERLEARLAQVERAIGGDSNEPGSPSLPRPGASQLEPEPSRVPSAATPKK